MMVVFLLVGGWLKPPCPVETRPPGLMAKELGAASLETSFPAETGGNDPGKFVWGKTIPKDP